MVNEQKYESIIEFKKHEFHVNGWNALEVTCGQLIGDNRDNKEEVEAACKAMASCMLEGDCYINDCHEQYDPDMTVRYYCDNLSSSRRKYQK